jgi:hypothetical protein
MLNAWTRPWSSVQLHLSVPVLIPVVLLPANPRIVLPGSDNGPMKSIETCEMQAVHRLLTPIGSKSVSNVVMIRRFPVLEDIAVATCNARADMHARCMVFGIDRCLNLIVMLE